MKIYRVTKTEYAKDLSGEGARLFGGRWNHKGDAMLYFSENLSLCILEVLVHMDFKLLSTNYSYIEIDIDEKHVLKLKNAKIVDEHWNASALHSKTQMYGSNWITSQKSLALSVPSAVVPQERNILVNPYHDLCKSLVISKVATLEIDNRFLK